jgi:hypothetical protein
MATDFEDETIVEMEEARAIERRAFAAWQTASAIPRLSRQLSDGIIAAMDHRGLTSEECVVNVGLKVAINPVPVPAPAQQEGAAA